MAYPSCKLSILIPVLNEGINLRLMLKLLNAVVEVPCEVLVIHDTEDDDSIEVVQTMQSYYSNLKLVHNNLGRGIPNAIRAGWNKAEGEILLLFAADEVGPVLSIEDMLVLMEEGCDFVSCTRYAYGGRRLGGSLVGGILSRAANFLFRQFSRSQFTDSTTGIKMFRRSLLDKIKLESDSVGWAVAFEMSIKAQLAGLQLGEVPIISIDRLYGGRSTFRPFPWIREYFRWFWWGFWNLGRQKKLPGVRVRIPLSSPLASHQVQKLASFHP